MPNLTPEEWAALMQQDAALSPGPGALSNFPTIPGAIPPLSGEMVPVQPGGTQETEQPLVLRVSPKKREEAPKDAPATQVAQEAPKAVPGPSPAPQPAIGPMPVPDANRESAWQDPAVLASQNAAMLAQQVPNAQYASLRSAQPAAAAPALAPAGALSPGAQAAPESGGDFMSWAKNNKDVIGALGSGLLMGTDFKDGLTKGLTLAERVKSDKKLSPKDLLELQLRMDAAQDRKDQNLFNRGIQERQLQLQQDAADERSRIAQEKQDEKNEKKDKAVSAAKAIYDRASGIGNIIDTDPNAVGFGSAWNKLVGDYTGGMAASGNYDKQVILERWARQEVLNNAGDMKGALSDGDRAYLETMVPKLGQGDKVWKDFITEVQKRVQANNPNVKFGSTETPTATTPTGKASDPFGIR